MALEEGWNPDRKCYPNDISLLSRLIFDPFSFFYLIIDEILSLIHFQSNPLWKWIKIMIHLCPKIQRNRKKGVTRKWTTLNGYPKTFDPLFSNFSPNNFWSSATNVSTMHDLNVDQLPDYCKKNSYFLKVAWIFRVQGP